MIRTTLAFSLALAAVVFAEAAPRATPETPRKLQDIPLPGGTQQDPTTTRDGIQIQERKFWRDAEVGKHARELEVKVDRIWSQGRDTLAAVSIRNTSPYDLDEISLQCRALAEDGRELAFQRQTLTTTEVEPIGPGFTKKLELTLDRSGAKIGSVSCNARGF